MTVGLNPPYGWGGGDTVRAYVKNASAITLPKGAVAAFDLANSGSDTDNNTLGAENSGFANIVTVSASARLAFPLCICEEEIASGEYGWVTIRGVVDALVGRSTGTTATVAGDYLVVDAANDRFLAADEATPAGAGARVCGVQLAATSGTHANGSAADGSDSFLLSVFFNGNGMGQAV